MKKQDPAPEATEDQQPIDPVQAAMDDLAHPARAAYDVEQRTFTYRQYVSAWLAQGGVPQAEENRDAEATAAAKFDREALGI